ncbi:MAG TPA: hypothetical protein PL002_16320, partial [Flavobacteriales bacterium]|nr:hypothetical protein [Flavobacteriales bacterium]
MGIRMSNKAVRGIISASFLVPCMLVHAQQPADRNRFDSLYVKDYSHILTLRAYISTKYNSLQLTAGNGAKDLLFRPN